MKRNLCQRQRGFTLVEMVMVIVILGIVGAMVAVFMRSPINAYFDTARRAALSDLADTATRRMARDIRKALPNSVRVPGPQCLEFIPTRTGGRYRADVDTSAGPGPQANSVLDFSAPDTRFNMLGDNAALPADQQIQVNDLIAVYNLGIPGADAYAGDNIATVTAVTNGAETNIAISSKKFPLASGGQRFHVVPGGEQVVAYVCTGGNLHRTVRTLAAASCPSSGAVLAGFVGACNFVYNGGNLQRDALAQLMMEFTNQGETVSVYHEVHVNNTP
jgi:MSHA biogenesis protein MshO